VTRVRESAPRDPHEEALARPTSRALAIRAKCWDCEGRDRGWRQRVQACDVVACPLWHVRPYQGVGSGVREMGLEKGPLRPVFRARNGNGEGG
jgi:hypothetical protein